VDQPFGGLGMVFVGDFAQLPPPVQAASLYSNLDSNQSQSYIAQKNAIGKGLWHQTTTVVLLRQNMRQQTQSAEDAKLRIALQNMRYKACTQGGHRVSQKLMC
jgi:hypothetical protein